MVAADEKFRHESTDLLQDQLEEAEETLSLCDLPIYGDFTSDAWSDNGCFSAESCADQEFFEFSSQDFDKSQSLIAPENIVFCGKIIPYKQQQPVLGGSERPQKTRTQRGRRPSWWRSLLLRWGVSSSRSCVVDKYGSLQQNSRWYLFVFGVGRFPMEMELRDMKTRQSRLKSKSGPITSTPMFVNGTAYDEKKKKKKSCRNHHGNGRGGAKASFLGCMPLL